MDKTLTAAKVSHTIVNALGDPQKQTAQADQCLANGAKVIIIAPLDSGSAAAIEKKAAARCQVDRLRPPGRGWQRRRLPLVRRQDGRQAPGRAVIAGLKAKGMYSKKPVVAELGRPDRRQRVPLQERQRRRPESAVQEQDADQGPAAVREGLGRTRRRRRIFEQMLVKTSNKIDGVAAANDNLANSVVVALKAHSLKPIPLSGQDATAAGRAEHHLRLADGDGVQGRPQAGGRRPRTRPSRSLNGKPVKYTTSSRRRAAARRRRS